MAARHIGSAIVILLLSFSSLRAASITLASGEVIQGEIQGRLVLSPGGRDVTFRVIEGRNVLAIGADGVHWEGDSLFLIGTAGASASDVLHALVWSDEGRGILVEDMRMQDLGRCRVLAVWAETAPAVRSREALLGDYEIDLATQTVRLTGVVHIRTANGDLLAVPVSDLAVAR